MRKWIPFLIAFLLPVAARAQYYPVSGFCVQGATTASVSGLQSTNYQQGIVPSCTITVYFAGTTTAVPGSQIFSNATGTVLGNPFTASATGLWIFFASNANQYTIVGSGGAPPNSYPSPVTLATVASVSTGAIYCGLSGCTLSGALFGPNINGEIYPASCGDASPPSWCSGTTADAWIRAACGQLPAGGGIINELGLTGSLAASISGCMSPTKQVIFLTDPTSLLTVTEADGGTVYPLDEYSMLLGPGGGQCLNTAGIRLAASANITAVAGPAHTDGTQESFTVQGVCMLGKPGATVSKGMVYANQVFTNTTINQNNLFACPTACVWLQDVGGEVLVQGNWLNVAAGVSGINGSDLVITGAVGGSSNVDVSGNTLEHANGGANYPEIRISGNGTGGASSAIHIHHDYIERITNSPYVPDTTAISITDCQGCSVDHVEGEGTGGGTNFILVSQTGAGRTQNVEINNVLATAWTNVLNDTITGITRPASATYNLAHYVVAAGFSDMPCSPLAATPGIPYTGQCWTSPADYRTNINAPSGQQQMAWLSDVATLPHSVGPDAMAGAGNFATGSANFGTNFSNTGCLTAQGLTCTFTRTNSTAPPGSTYSQEVQITVNADPNGGFNGVQFGTPVSFTGGQPYVVSFWGKGDGSFTGTATFLLWNSTVPIFYCQDSVNTPFTTSWTLYTFVCVPPSSGSSNLAIVATTPVGQTGTFYLGGFTFSPVTPLTVGANLVATGPYEVGSALLYNAAANPLPTCNAAANGQQFTVSDATSPTFMGVYASGGGVTASVLCSYSGSAYSWVTH
jgi:hypothetical protein